MFNLQNLCCNLIAKNVTGTLSQILDKRYSKVPSHLANILITPILEEIVERDIDPNYFSKMDLTDFSKAKRPLKRVAVGIVASCWRQNLQALIFPEDSDFLGVSLEGEKFQKLKNLQLEKPKNLSKESLCDLIACLPVDLRSFKP